MSLNPPSILQCIILELVPNLLQMLHLTQSQSTLEPIFDPVSVHGDPVDDAKLSDLPQEDRIKLAINAIRSNPQISITWTRKAFNLVLLVGQRHL